MRLLVEDIQDMVEHQLMQEGKFDLAKAYIIYRYTRALVRKANTTDESILSLIRNSNKDVMEENRKKFPKRMTKAQFISMMPIISFSLFLTAA